MSAPRFQHRSAAYPMSASRRTDAGLDWKQDFMITPPVSKLYQAVSAFSASNRKVHHCWVAAEYCPFTWKQSQAPQRVSNLCHHTNSDRAGCPLSALPLCASPECAQLFPEHLPTCPLLQPKPEVASGKKKWVMEILPSSPLHFQTGSSRTFAICIKHAQLIWSLHIKTKITSLPLHFFLTFTFPHSAPA